MYIDEIRYLLFRKTRSQALIPFLGAGVSDSEKKIFLDYNRGDQFKKLTIDTKLFDNILSQLGFEGKAKLFMMLALNTAFLISESENEKTSIEEKTINKNKENDKYPPSSNELIEIFENYIGSSFKFVSRKISELMPHISILEHEEEISDLIKYVVKLWGLPNFSTTLSTVAEKYELMFHRYSLIENLYELFQNRIEVTRTHHLIAEVASSHLKNNDAEDFLIITTNYDCLMEKALNIKKIPYTVITWNFYDEKIYLQFSENVENIEKLKKLNPPKYPINFYLNKGKTNKPFVIIYKIHGSLDDPNKKNDGIVITQNDYYTFVSKMSSSYGIFPGWVVKKIRETPILFLGYSLRDWNIRQGLLKNRHRFRIKDFIISRLFSNYEKRFYDKNNIVAIESDLHTFTDIIYNSIPKS